MTAFNPARKKAFQAFKNTLTALHGKPSISEIDFRDAWLSRLQQDTGLYADGWYDPPPHGLSVLFAPELDPTRLSFGSLRDPVVWPGKTIADWSGFMFAYASCVDRETGLIGDFDLTLYFGNNPKLKSHYLNCHTATQELLNAVRSDDTSQQIYKRSEIIFSRAGLKNCVVSTTDTSPVDIGHTFPSLPKDTLKIYPEALASLEKKHLSTMRRFINDVVDWEIEDGTHFSIEPQLRSMTDPTLPQISFHYLLTVSNGRVDICRDIDDLIHL